MEPEIPNDDLLQDKSEQMNITNEKNGVKESKTNGVRASATVWKETIRTTLGLEAKEFGGPIGTFCIMAWSHFILFYFWYCLESADGKMVIPLSPDSLMQSLSGFRDLFLTKGIPSIYTWSIYLSFFVSQLLFAAILPGFDTYGLPIPPSNIRLIYHCNGYTSYYSTMMGLFILQMLGLFRIEYLAEHYGELLITSMLIGDVTSVFWYIYGILFVDENVGKQARTGNVIYDFFMGTIRYPRIGEVDIKMIAEVRWSWMTLMLITVSCAVAQYKKIGYVSPQMFHMLTAHWLYSNATVKGEHCIPCTWDMFRENYGWMLNFWNICGVPFLYCFQSLYILRNQDSLVHYPTYLIIGNYMLLLMAYCIFASANSQKANFKSTTRRHLFPDLPWSILEPPIRVLQTPNGILLMDGWYAYARKAQYTGDILMALSWGLSCGFGSFLPYFYVTFFIAMIVHRQSRDEARCRLKYGKYWDIYVQSVPNVFIPSLSFFVWLLTGKEPTFPLLSDSITKNETKKDE
jgi:delta24(24(1))-sterol reductase